MMSASLRQFLQSLCCTFPWDYAAMWRLQLHRGQAILTWDDGVFDIPKAREPMESMMASQDFYCSDGMLFSTYPSTTQKGNWVDSPMAVLMTKMSSIYYVVGKGVVGEVAHTGTSCWIYAEELMCGKFQCPDELLHQFVAGIKTILLVPLPPYGVLQLGSLDKVAEDAELVMCIKKKFEADQHYACYFALSSSERKLAHMTSHAEDLGQLSDNATDRTNRTASVLDNVVVESNSMLNVDQMIKEVSGSVSESKSSLESGAQFDFVEHLSYPYHEHGESDMKQNFSGSARPNEDIDVFSYFTDFKTLPSEISVNKNMQDFPHGSVDPPYLSEFDGSTFQSGRHLLRFPSDCELHKVIGSVVSDHADLKPSRSDVSSKNAGACEKYYIHRDQQLACDYGVRSDEDYMVQDLLEAVLANGSSILDDNSSEVSLSPISFKGLARNLESCDIAYATSEVDDLFPCVTSLSNGEKDPRKISPLPSSFNLISALLEERPEKDGKIYTQPTKGLKQNGSNKRRARLGDNQKSRPRDRQLIQDRIKELRELVPHSAKGSIDSLLDRTIKHMQFLRSVANQADKIKPHLIKKASEHKALKSPLAKGNDQNGTSWAVELSGEEQKCPIIVKDLEYPGHMLIEMLCSDHGRFLEIADVIHRSKLTILKGWMEKRSDDCTWAHFIVEASGSFHRLDIFWPLMQLVQQNRTQISSRI